MFCLYLRKPGRDSQYLLTNNMFSIYSPSNFKMLCKNPSYGWEVAYEKPEDRYQLLATINSYQELVDKFPELLI